MPPQLLREALDDNGDKAEDAGLFDTLAMRASRDVDGILGQRFRVPFSQPVPPIVSRAARIFLLAALYRRRQVPDERNPYARMEREIVEKLSRIAVGSEPLMPAAAKGEADIASERARTYDDRGRISI